MVQRGRKSAASQAVSNLVSPLASEKRLSPPVHITDGERVVWLEVVSDQPAGAFSATHAPLLASYCRHVVREQILAVEIEVFDRSWLARDDGLKRYDRLLAMAERESRAASSLATRLRITRQAVEHPTTVGRTLANQSKARKPWELPLENE